MRLNYAFEYACKRWKQQKAEDQLRQEEMMKEQEDEMNALSVSESGDKIDEQQRQQEESTQDGALTTSPAPTARLLPQTEAAADEAKEMSILSVTETDDKVDGDQKQQEEKEQVIEQIISPSKAEHGETEKCDMPEQEEKVEEKEAVTSSMWVAQTEAKKVDHDKDQKQAHQGEEQQRKPSVLTTCQDEGMEAQRHQTIAERKRVEKEAAHNTFKAGPRRAGTSVQNLEHFITIRVWSTKEKKWTTVQRPTVSPLHVYLAVIIPQLLHNVCIKNLFLVHTYSHSCLHLLSV